MNELALFAGAGGGILGGKLLGFRSAVLAKLPTGYFGDLCPECGLLMVAINKLEESK